MTRAKPVEFSVDEPGEIEAPFDDAVQGIRDAFAANHDDQWECKIFRVSGSNRERIPERYLFSCEATELDGAADKVRDEYGTGRYRVRVYQNGRLARGGFDFEVEAPTLRDQQNRAGSGDMASIVAAINEGNRQNMQFMQQMMERRSAPEPVQPADPLAMMERMSTIMANMRNAEPERSRGGGDSSISAFKQGIELAQTIAGAATGNGETGILDVIKSVLTSGAVSTFVQNLSGQNGGNMQPPVQQGAYGEAVQPPQQGPAKPFRMAPPPPIAPENITGDQEKAMQFVQQQVRYLCSRAANGSDPQLYAEYVLDNLPEGTVGYLLGHPDVLRELAVMVPNVNNFRGWFEKLIEEVRYLAENGPQNPGTYNATPGAADANDSHSGGGQGNDGHAPNNGGAGQSI